MQRGVLPEGLRDLAPDLRFMASVCTGSLVLASAGLLMGRPATSNRNALGELRDRGASVVPERVVDDGDLITAGGLTAGLDLGLWIIERELGSEAANRRAVDIEYIRQGNVWNQGIIVVRAPVSRDTPM